MLSNVKRYLRVKREAMRLMMIGDLARYMHKLRELQELRPRTGGWQPEQVRKTRVPGFGEARGGALRGAAAAFYKEPTPTKGSMTFSGAIAAFAGKPP